MKDSLKSKALMVYGVAYVMMDGINQMLTLFVECLGTLLLKLCTLLQNPLVMGVMETLYLIILNALGMKHLYLIVQLAQKEKKIVVLQNGLVSNAPCLVLVTELVQTKVPVTIQLETALVILDSMVQHVQVVQVRRIIEVVAAP